MVSYTIPYFPFLPIGDLREKFELSQSAFLYKLNFKEYAVLYRIMEGSRPSQIFESLYVSHATVSRSRRSLTDKLKAATFEQALILVGKLEILCD